MPEPRLSRPVRLAGVGHYFPGDPVTNDYFADLPDLGIDDAWIREHTGVLSRHWPADGGERIAEMGAKAAQMALKDADLDASDVDVLIGTSATARPRTNPTAPGNNYMDVSLPVQRLIEATSAFCFDVTAVACAGFLYGSVVARSLLHDLGARTALVVCAENPKPILNFRYRNSALFGAGAAAAVWTTEGAVAGGGLLDAVLRADGRHYDAFDIDDEDKMIMKGRRVGELGPDLLVEAGRRVLERNGLTAADVAWCVPHQANTTMLEPFARRLGIPRDRVLMNLPRRGNTSSAGMPSALSEHVHAGVINPGDLLLGVSIGRGFSWGAMLLTYK